MKKLSYKTLYMAWALMFAVTAALGFLVPETDSVPGRVALAAVTGLFFVPPWVILARAKGEENRHHIRLIRWLSLASVVLTAVLLVLNLRSAGLSEGMGRALNAALTVVSAPMMCANTFAVPLFLWGTLLTDTFRKK